MQSFPHSKAQQGFYDHVVWDWTASTTKRTWPQSIHGKYVLNLMMSLHIKNVKHDKYNIPSTKNVEKRSNAHYS